MPHAAIADRRQVDLIEPMPLGKPGEIGQPERPVNRIRGIARLSAVDGPGVGFNRAFRIFDAQRAAVAPV